MKSISFLKDDSESITVQNITSATFQPLQSSIGFNDAPFWFKITLQENISESIYIEIKETFLKEIKLYNNSKELLFNSNDIKDSHVKIPLNNYSKTLYLRVIFDKHPYISIAAYDQAYLESNENLSFIKKGGFYMLILIFVLLNLLLYFSFKDTLFLWYILFFMSVNLGIALYDNTIANLIYQPTYINYLLALEYWITPIAAAIFCIRFLKIQEFYPKIVTYVKVLLAIVTLLIVIFLATQNFKFVAVAQLINLTIYLGSWIIGFFLLKKVPAAKYYVLGYFTLYLSALLYSLSVNFGIHFFPLTIEHLKIGILIEISVLTFAVMQRTKNLVKENNTIKDQLLFYIEELKSYKENNTQKETNIEELIISEAKKYNLTDRETDVLLYLTKGLNNKQIAEELFISPNTLKYHTRNIYEKLDINKRTAITSKLLFNS